MSPELRHRAQCGIPEEIIRLPVGVIRYQDGTFGVETNADPYIAGVHHILAVFATEADARAWAGIHRRRLA